MPGWPIDKELRRRFVLWSVALCCGLLIGIPLLKIFVERFEVPPPPPRTAKDIEEQLTPPDFGEKLPMDYDWTLSTLDDQEFYMADLRGKVVFLNFWASWCPPCVVEMPAIQHLYDTFSDKDVVFVGISREDPEVVREFVEEHGYTFPIYTIDAERPDVFSY